MSGSREDADTWMVAFLKASVLMKLPSETISAVLQTGLHEIYLMRTGEDFLELHVEAFERAKCLVRMWRQLVRLNRSDSEAACAWMHTPCEDFGGRPPAHVLADRDGLYQVADYVRLRSEAAEPARPSPPSVGE